MYYPYLKGIFKILSKGGASKTKGCDVSQKLDMFTVNHILNFGRPAMFIAYDGGCPFVISPKMIIFFHLKCWIAFEFCCSDIKYLI